MSPEPAEISMPESLDFLTGGGEMARVVAAKDWSKTPLGPIADWPQSLRTTVSLCLASNFPISLAWGPERIQIYNDGYRIVCGAKHPDAVGQDFRKCWASAWPAIGEAFESAERGETRYLENQRMFLDRNGYLEETFFTFSFSPIRAKGGIEGLFHPVTETTARMLSERRTRALRDLASGAHESISVETACAAVARVLAECELDVPFALIYLRGNNNDLILAGSAGVEGTGSGGITDISLAAPGLAILTKAITTHKAQTGHRLMERLGLRVRSPYPEPGTKTMVLSLAGSGVERSAGILIAGVSSRLPLDDAYRSFYALLAAQVSSAISSARAYEEERRRAEALAELDKAKTAFFASVSHEFRTPLTLILGPLEELLAKPADAVASRVELEPVYRNALRLLRLVNTLLEFSRLESGRVQAVFEPVNLTELTADAASIFRSAIEKAGLRFVVDCAPLSQPVYVDRSMWETILLNLLSNALKFTFEGEIRLRLREGDGEITLRVEDTGTGIAAEEIPRLFERFYRIEGSRSRTFEGSGIGLSLVKELVKLHGGSVHVQSEAAVGSTFAISLPTGFAHLPQDRVRAGSGEEQEQRTASKRLAFVEEASRWVFSPKSEVTPAAAEPGARRPRILLADDNTDMREYIERLLAPAYEVQAVGNGAEALAAALAEPPDLVLSDVMMPELDGFGLLSSLRGRDSTRLVPVVLLSARAGEEARMEGIGAGADDYIVKPFVARELMARIRTRIELTQLRARLQQEEALRINAEKMGKQWQLFDAVLSHTPDHVYIYDRAGRFLYANQATLAFCQTSIEECLGNNLRGLQIPEEIAATIEGHVRQVICSGQPVRHEVLLPDPEGRENHYEYVFSPVMDAGGQVHAVAGRSRDTTEQNAIQARLHDLVARLESALAEKTALTQEVEHRVKNNLAVIAGLLGEQAERSDSDEAKSALRASRQRVHAMALVHDHLYSDESMERMNFGRYVEQLVDDVRSQHRTDHEPPEVRVDVEHVHLSMDRAIPCGLILNELLGNAFQHAFPSGTNGRITVRAIRLAPSELVLSCGDNGVGLPTDLNWRNTPSLGLEMVGILASQLRGQVTLHQSDGETRFEVRFPLD